MMSGRSQKLWLTFGLLVLLSLAGLTWITMNAIQWARDRHAFQIEQSRLLESAERANKALEHQQKISEALWLADSLTAPLLSHESAQPIRNYEAWNSSIAMGNENRGAIQNTNASNPFACSPLLLNRSPIVLLHFQFEANGRLSSPQVPDEATWPLAMQAGVSEHCLQEDHELWSKLNESRAVRDRLGRLLVDQSLPIAMETTMFRQGLLSPPSNTGREFAGQRNSRTEIEPNDNTGLPSIPSIEAYNKGNRAAPSQNARLRSRAQTVSELAANSAFQQQVQSTNPLQSTQAEAPSDNRFVNLRSPSQFFWIEGKLVQLRKVEVDRQYLLQGCWIDWNMLSSWLSEQLQAELPGVELIPVDQDVGQGPSSQQMANLPVRLQWQESSPTPPSDIAAAALPVDAWYRILLWPLGMTWTVWTLGTLGSALMLRGVLQLSERRATFVSAVSHELRTPLTTFRLYTDLMISNQGLSEDRKQDYLETLQGQAERLTRLVENVLAFSKLDGSVARPQRKPIRFDDLLGSIQRRVQEILLRYDAGIRLEVDESAKSLVVDTNLEAVEQIAINLIENACKYGMTLEERNIAIEARRIGNLLELDFVDHGAGIASEFRKKLFQPFSRSAEQAAGKAPGIGLGLSLARGLARQIGARLSLVDSRQGQTRFRLEIPIAQS